MTSTAKKILTEALTLSDDERRKLGEAILDSLPRSNADEIRAAWVEESMRRAEEVEHDRGPTLDLKTALDELRSDLKSAKKK